MAHIKSVLKGVIHGRRIELETEPGLPDGQAVSVIVEPVVPKDSQAAYEALKRAAGAWEVSQAWKRWRVEAPTRRRPSSISLSAAPR